MKKGQGDETEFLIVMGSRIRQLRKERGLTQAKLATLINSDKAALCRIEAGQTNATLLTLKRIVDNIGVPFHDLF